MVGKRHQKRLDRIARRKAAKERAKRSAYSIGDKGSCYKNGERIGYIECSEAWAFSLGPDVYLAWKEGRIEYGSEQVRIVY